LETKRCAYIVSCVNYKRHLKTRYNEVTVKINES